MEPECIYCKSKKTRYWGTRKIVNGAYKLFKCLNCKKLFKEPSESD